MANILGITQETLIRMLNYYKQENLLDVDGKQIVLKDVPSLQKVAAL